MLFPLQIKLFLLQLYKTNLKHHEAAQHPKTVHKMYFISYISGILYNRVKKKLRTRKFIFLVALQKMLHNLI